MSAVVKCAAPPTPSLLDVPTEGDPTQALLPACAPMHTELRDLLTFSSDGEDDKMLQSFS
jgi:hypothetical protein